MLVSPKEDLALLVIVAFPKGLSISLSPATLPHSVGEKWFLFVLIYSTDF